MRISSELLAKYEISLPRYTSFPTLPHWDQNHFQPSKAIQLLKNQVLLDPRVSLYIHLPFCESLCTFCGCNKRITRNHQVEAPYIQSILEEWRLYKMLLPTQPVISHIHLGGGTPTFFSPEQLTILITGLLNGQKTAEEYEFSVEVHPNTCTTEHLKTLYNLGFRRISVGIQDFDPKVLYSINRNQTFEKTRSIIEEARNIGFTGINVDLVYGLPLQTLDSIAYTLEKIEKLKPHRIAYYAYAHVPWKSKAQRRYTEKDLPASADRFNMFLFARKWLLSTGYVQVGMDHFAMPHDPLSIAFKAGELNRNFMGYTTDTSPTLIGLGASSISDFNTAYVQNYKEVETYQSVIASGQLAIEKGHLLTEEDITIKRHIMDVMCKGKIKLPNDLSPEHLAYIEEKITEFINDGLLQWENESLVATEAGLLLIRNIASIMDPYLYRLGMRDNVFSKSI